MTKRDRHMHRYFVTAKEEQAAARRAEIRRAVEVPARPFEAGRRILPTINKVA